MSGSVAPVVRKDAPRPIDMLHVLPLLEEASALFVLERYAGSHSALTTILDEGSPQSRRGAAPGDVAFMLKQDAQALAAFRRAAAIAPRSADVRRLPGAALRTRDRIGGRRYRCSRGSWRSRRQRQPAVEALAAAEGPAWRKRRMAARADRRADRRIRAGASAGRFHTTSSSACSTWPSGGSRRHEQRSTASPHRIPATRWPSSSAPRSASC